MVATITFDSTDWDDTTLADNQQYTFAMTGAAATGQERLVAVAGVGGPVATVDFDACTIAGQTATRVGTVSRGPDNGSGFCAFITIYRAPGTSGTSFNVVVTVNCPGNAVYTGVCGLVKLNDAIAGTFASRNTSGNDPVLSLNTATGGAVLAASYGIDDVIISNTWTGLTERWDSVSTDNNDSFTGASVDVVTGETPRVISIDMPSGRTESVASIAVSFSPIAASQHRMFMVF